MMSSPLFQNNFILRRPGVVIFADIIKIVTFLLRQPLKTQKSLKNYKFYIKKQSIHVVLDIAKLTDFRWKFSDVSGTQGVGHVIHISFWSFYVRYNSAKFHHCRICVRDWAVHLWVAPKKPILKGEIQTYDNCY